MESFFSSAPNLQPEASPSEPAADAPAPEPTPTWTYPTRMCRICREDVVPTVSMYPPGLPPSFQRPLVEYKNEDEYGRLIRPCKCRGGMRYIHELCLLRSRTEGVRPGSLWKCHECGHQFNFKKLTLQKYLGSKLVSGALTVLVMLLIMFMLGFIADPLINLYVDPYDTLIGAEDVWTEVDLNDAGDALSGWSLHFVKGLVSMGLVGFLKTALLNPFQWWNLRASGWTSGRSSGTSTTGRDRAVNISWIAVVIGISSAFYFFYQWVQTIISQTLKSIGNNIVDTQLPGDDDDLKPPPGWKPEVPQPAEATDPAGQPEHATIRAESTSSANPSEKTSSASTVELDGPWEDVPRPSEARHRAEGEPKEHPAAGPSTTLQDRAVHTTADTAYSSALNNARNQGWSFAGIEN